MSLSYILQKLDALGPLEPRTSLVLDQSFTGSTSLVTLFRAVLGTDAVTINVITDLISRSDEELVLIGTASLLGLTDAQVTLTARDAENDLFVKIEIVLPAGWYFSQTFPDLPEGAVVLDIGLVQGCVGHFLDQLSLGAAKLVMSNKDYRDDALGLDVVRGLNFTGEFYFNGVLYSLGSLLDQDDPVALTGPLVEARTTADPLQFLGIRLSAPFRIPLSNFGPLSIRSSQVYIKSGRDAYEVDRVVSATQKAGIYVLLDATLSGRPLEMVGAYDVENEPSNFFVRGRFTDFAVAGFGGLSQSVGVEGFGDTMPEDAPTPEGLSITEFGIGVETIDRSVTSLLLGVGCQMEWNLIPDVMTLREVALSFFVTNPFDAERSIQTTLSGLLAFEKFSLAASASFPNYEFLVGLPQGETLPLGDVVESFLPTAVDLPAMTITKLLLDASPKASTYSVTAAMEDLLSIPVGATSFDITGFSLAIAYEKAAGARGALTARMAMAGANVIVSGDLNQALTLSGSLENFDLKQFWSLVTGGDSLPDAIPDILLQTLTVRYTPKTGAFSAQGRATIGWEFISNGDGLTTNVEFSFVRNVIVTNGVSTSTINASLSLQGTGPVDLAPGLQLGAFNFLFDYQAGTAWKLSGGVNAEIFDTALYLQAGYEANQLGDKITLQAMATPDKKLINLAGIGSYSFRQFDLIIDRRSVEGGKTQTFFDLRLASTLALNGIFSIGGYLSISKSPVGTMGLLFKPNPGTAAFDIQFPTGEGFGLSAELFEVGFVKDAAGWNFTGSLYIGFTGLPSSWAAALPSKMFAKLEAGGKGTKISAVNVTDVIAVPLPSTGGKDLGKLSVQMLELGVAIHPELGLSTDIGLGFPAELNTLLGSEIFRVYQEGNPLTMCRTRFTITSTGVAAQFLTSPLATVNTIAVDGETWFDIDFGKYGAISLKMPTFVYDGVSQYFEAGGGCRVTRPLAVPLVPLKAFLMACGSQDFADMFPDKVPVNALSLVDAQNHLKVDELIAFIKQVGDVPQEVVQAIKQAGNVLDRFPEGFKQYFKIEVPESLEFKFGFSPTGRIGLALLAPETPVRVMFPSTVQSYVPMPGLTGMELRKIAVGTISAGSLFYGDVDAVIDQFDMPSLALSLMLPTDDDFPLPTADQLQRRLVLKNVFCMITSAPPIPIPVFYDEIGFDYVGIEGLGLGAHISFPQPTSSGLAEFLTTLQDFVTDSKTRLDPNKPPAGMELAYRFWDEYVQAPEYLGGGALGMKGRQATVSLWRYIATMMNFFKSFSINDFVGAIPIEYRVGSKSCKFAFLQFDADWLLTTPAEFQNGAFEQLRLTASDRDDFIDVLPAVTSAQGKTIAGNEQGLVTFVRGQADLGFARLELVYGLAASGTLGFNTGFKIAGGIGTVVDFELSGAVMVNAPLAEQGPAAPAPTPAAAPTPGEKMLHDGLIFSGKGDYCIIPKSDKFVTTQYTVEAWIRPDKDPTESWQEVWGGNGKSPKLYIHTSGLVSHRFFAGGQYKTFNTAEGVIRWGEWNHVALTNDGQTYMTYVNGVERSRGTVPGTLVNEAAAIQIGRQHEGNAQCQFRGSIDDLRYFRVARTPTQIKNEMDVALKGNEAGLVAYYTMDHASGNQLVDMGPNKLHGTVYGASWALAVAPADTKRAAIQIQGHTHLTVAGHKALVGDLRVVDSEFWFTGELDLFPKNWPLRVRGHVEGMLSGKRFYLTGQTENALFGVVLSRSRLYVSNDQMRLEGIWLGMFTLLEISWDKNDPYLRGALFFDRSLTVDFGTIRIRGVKVANNVRISLSAEASMNALITKAGFSADVDTRFAIGGNAFALAFRLNVAPSELTAVFDEFTRKLIADPLKYLGHLFTDATTWLTNVGNGAIDFATDAAAELGTALKSAFNVSKDALASLLKGAGYSASVVGNALTSAYAATAEDAARLLQGAAYAVDDVGAFLSGSGIDAQTAARYLKNIGYDAKSVGSALKSAYSKGYQDAAKVLKNAGFNSDQVSGALKDTFKVDYNAATSALKSAGFTAEQIGGSLKGVYGASSDQVGKALKAAGFSADDIAGVMKDVYGMSAKETAKLLKGSLDYGKGTVKDALGSAGFSNKDINKALDWLGGLF